jgi:hypothetical protein
MDNKKILLLVQLLPLLIPINYYVIGDWSGNGIQWALFRFQETYLGTSLILITQDVGYVIFGILGSRTGTSVLVWYSGSAVLVAAFLITAYRFYVEQTFNIDKRLHLLPFFACFLFCLSCILQYGIMFKGPAGISIPIGIPVIIIAGFWQYRQFNTDEPDFIDKQETEVLK